MPSPLGHALAGVAIAWAADLVPGDRTWRVAPATASWYTRAGNGLTLTCAILAAAPDLDLLLPGTHRSFTHSVTAGVTAGMVAAIIAWLSGGARKRRAARIGLMCAAAWGSHLVLDWLGADPSPPHGLQMLWPFSHRWFISALDIFPVTERRHVLSRAAIRINFSTALTEIAILAPIAAVLWSVRVKALAGLASQLSRGDQTSQ